MTSEGFYEIQVADSHYADLADEWGPFLKEVQQEITRDNQERLLMCAKLNESFIQQGDKESDSDKGSKMEL